MSLDQLFSKLKGGSGSGNFGHSGRPGKRGGSSTSSSGGSSFNSESDIYINAAKIEKEMKEKARSQGVEDEFSLLLGDNYDLLSKANRNYRSVDENTPKGEELKSMGFEVEEGRVYYEKNPPGWMPSNLKGKVLSYGFAQNMGLKSYFHEPPNRIAKENFLKSLNGDYGDRYKTAANIIKNASQDVFKSKFGSKATFYRAGSLSSVMSVSESSGMASRAGSVVSGQRKKSEPIEIKASDVLVSHRVVQTPYPEREWIVKK